MVLGWIALIIEIMILSIINPLLIDIETAVVILIGINILFVLFSFKKYTIKYTLIFTIAYFIRIIAMFWDKYGRSVFIFPNSGADSVGFYNIAEQISNNLELLETKVYGGLYSKINGILFYFTKSEILLGQYINVMLGITIIVILYKTLTLLNIEDSIKKKAVLLLSLFPQAIISSAIFLRENYITLFLLLSFYYFIKWYLKGEVKNIIINLICVLIASIFHSGVIFIAIGYLFMYMVYERESRRVHISRKTIGLFIVFSGIVFILVNYYGDTFFVHFNQVDDITDIYSKVNSRIGGSAYLINLKIDAIWKLILYSPIKIFYFLIAPLPWDWRGFNDILTFFIDSLIYFYLIFTSFKKIKKTGSRDPLILGVLIILLIPTFTFGIAVSNAGTAMRHRHKLLPIIICIRSLINSKEMKTIEPNNN